VDGQARRSGTRRRRRWCIAGWSAFMHRFLRQPNLPTDLPVLTQSGARRRVPLRHPYRSAVARGVPARRTDRRMHDRLQPRPPGLAPQQPAHRTSRPVLRIRHRPDGGAAGHPRTRAQIRHGRQLRLSLATNPRLTPREMIRRLSLLHPARPSRCDKDSAGTRPSRRSACGTSPRPSRCLVPARTGSDRCPRRGTPSSRVLRDRPLPRWRGSRACVPRLRQRSRPTCATGRSDGVR
jgi:hypothetical protein